MGAKLTAPRQSCRKRDGDGSFGMTGMEIETAARHGIRMVTIILNNQSLNATRQTQHSRFEGREIGIALGGDYSKLAQALGGYGERVEQPKDLKGAITRALTQPVPAVLDVLVKPLEPRS